MISVLAFRASRRLNFLCHWMNEVSVREQNLNLSCSCPCTPGAMQLDADGALVELSTQSLLTSSWRAACTE